MLAVLAVLVVRAAAQVSGENAEGGGEIREDEGWSMPRRGVKGELHKIQREAAHIRQIEAIGCMFMDASFHPPLGSSMKLRIMGPLRKGPLRGP